jgi:hypothetical protein
MKTLIMTSLMSVFAFTTAINAAGVPRTYSFQPCSSWIYSSMANGFVCNFPSSTSYVTDVRDVAAMARTIEDLKAQVDDLTKRVEALESR